MAVEVKFGNLGIDELERDLGIKLTEADRKFLQETRQEQVMNGEGALKMPSRSWHFLICREFLNLVATLSIWRLRNCFQTMRLKDDWKLVLYLLMTRKSRTFMN